ncbi:MAG TPA: hypothetical protein VJB70_04750 [Candidatus Paceibacterota bacterium]
MKIVAIVGVLDFPGSEKYFWKPIKDEFLTCFPNSSFEVAHAFFLPWQKKKIKEFMKSVLRKYDTGEEILLIGHSLGGVVACSLVSSFTKSTIVGVVTILSPHRIKMFYKMLNVSQENLQVPIISFGGIFDIIVPYFFSKPKYSTLHTLLTTDHLLFFLLSHAPARKIAQITKSYFKNS